MHPVAATTYKIDTFRFRVKCWRALGILIGFFFFIFCSSSLFWFVRIAYMGIGHSHSLHVLYLNVFLFNSTVCNNANDRVRNRLISLTYSLIGYFDLGKRKTMEIVNAVDLLDSFYRSQSNTVDESVRI